MTSPDLPATARLRAAARNHRLLAAAIRAEHPPRRAVSRHAMVEAAADGRLLGIEVSVGELSGSRLARHLVELYHAATHPGVPAGEGVAVTELDRRRDAPHPGLGRRRFDLPAGVDPDAPPAELVQQLTGRLRSRWEAAQRAAPRLAELLGVGTALDGQVVVRLASGERLDSVTLSTWTRELPADDLNVALEHALTLARADLRAQARVVLDEAGARP